MPTDHTLKRILSQISEHKEELAKIPSGDAFFEKAEEESPVKDVGEFFSEEELRKRAEQTSEPLPSDRVPLPPSAGEQALPGMEEQVLGHPDHISLEALPEEEKANLAAEKEKYEFRSVFDFKDFVLMFHEKFDDFQKAALNSIVTVCDTIEVGCKCKRNTRLNVAENYYIEFITQNQHSGILEKFKELLNTKRIKFYSKDKLFLER